MVDVRRSHRSWDEPVVVRCAYVNRGVGDSILSTVAWSRRATISHRILPWGVWISMARLPDGENWAQSKCSRCLD